MYRLNIPLFAVLFVFLALIPIFEPVTRLEEVILIFMLWACLMVQYSSLVEWRCKIVHAKTEITMKDILHRYPQYAKPRNSHRKV